MTGPAASQESISNPERGKAVEALPDHKCLSGYLSRGLREGGGLLGPIKTTESAQAANIHDALRSIFGPAKTTRQSQSSAVSFRILSTPDQPNPAPIKHNR